MSQKDPFERWEEIIFSLPWCVVALVIAVLVALWSVVWFFRGL